MSDLYLDLMKKSLLASIYDENAWYVLGTREKKTSSLKALAKSAAIKMAWAKGFLIVKPTKLMPTRQIGACSQ